MKRLALSKIADVDFKILRVAAKFGDILAVHGTSIPARIVQWKTNSEIYHVAPCIGNGNMIDTTFFKGVSERPIDVFKDCKCMLLRPVVVPSEEQDKLAMDWLTAQIGKGYDKLAILGFAINRNLDSRDKWFCSEEVYVFCKKRGIVLVNNVPKGLIPPQLIVTSTQLRPICKSGY